MTAPTHRDTHGDDPRVIVGTAKVNAILKAVRLNERAMPHQNAEWCHCSPMRWPHADFSATSN